MKKRRTIWKSTPLWKPTTLKLKASLQKREDLTREPRYFYREPCVPPQRITYDYN